MILTQDVPNVGIANEVVVLRWMVSLGTTCCLESLQLLQLVRVLTNEQQRFKKAKERKAIRLAEASELAERMSRLKVSFERKASEEGRLLVR